MKLLNQSEKTFEFRLTKNPVTNPQQSLKPGGKGLDDLDPKKSNYNLEREQILKHPNYSTNELVTVVPGINDYKNSEHAEWIYMTLGNPEDGGAVPVGIKGSRNVTNKNFIWEVDKEGNPIKGELFDKYRQQSGVAMNMEADPALFKMKE